MRLEREKGRGVYGRPCSQSPWTRGDIPRAFQQRAKGIEDLFERLLDSDALELWH